MLVWQHKILPRGLSARGEPRPFRAGTLGTRGVVLGTESERISGFSMTVRCQIPVQSTRPKSGVPKKNKKPHRDRLHRVGGTRRGPGGLSRRPGGQLPSNLGAPFTRSDTACQGPNLGLLPPRPGGDVGKNMAYGLYRAHGHGKALKIETWAPFLSKSSFWIYFFR